MPSKKSATAKPPTKQAKISGTFDVRRRQNESSLEAALKSKSVNKPSPEHNKELAASHLTPAEIEKFVNDPIYEDALREILGSDTSPRFHQQHLNTVDKLLLQFDMTADYGPCGGLTRLDRWNRAHKLHRHPHPVVKHALESPLGQLDRYKYSYVP